MAVIQDEQGNNKPIKTDTSHVFDVNGNPLHGELFIGETIASDDVEAIDGFAHESDIDAINQNLAELKTINYDYNNARFIGMYALGAGFNLIIPTPSLAINPQASHLSIYYNRAWLDLTISVVSARDNGILIAGSTTTTLTDGSAYLARCSVTATLT